MQGRRSDYDEGKAGLVGPGFGPCCEDSSRQPIESAKRGALAAWPCIKRGRGDFISSIRLARGSILPHSFNGTRLPVLLLFLHLSAIPSRADPCPSRPLPLCVTWSGLTPFLCCYLSFDICRPPLTPTPSSLHQSSSGRADGRLAMEKGRRKKKK